jgi:hypothetical protein
MPVLDGQFLTLRMAKTHQSASHRPLLTWYLAAHHYSPSQSYLANPAAYSPSDLFLSPSVADASPLTTPPSLRCRELE